MRFTSSQRLRRTVEFDAVRSAGFRVDCGTFLFSILPREGEGISPVRRLGVIASRRVGDAVRRNYCKRRLREVFRLHQQNLPADCDVVLIARRSLMHEPFSQTEERFVKSSRKMSSRFGGRPEDGS